MTYLLVQYPERKVVFVSEELDVLMNNMMGRIEGQLLGRKHMAEPTSDTYRVETVR